jgi:hypothetical protein
MYATGLTLFYYDQRVRKEGFDIEWMMEAAGMNAHVPSAGDEAAATPLQVPGDAVEPWPELEPAPATEPVPDGESAAQGGPLEALEQAPADESGPAQLPNESNHG